MSRATFRTQCSEWRKCLVNCLCCRPQDSHPLEVLDPRGEEVEQPDCTFEVPPTFNTLNPTREDVDKLLDAVTQLCERLQRGTSSTTNRLTFQLIEYKDSADSFIKGLPQDFTNQVGQDLLTDALRGLGGLHWATAGLCFVAWALDGIIKAKKTPDTCLELLKRTILSLENTIELWEVNTEGRDAGYLQDSILIALQCALACKSMIDDHYLKRFFCHRTIEDSIADLKKDLDRALQQNTNVAATSTHTDVKALMKECKIVRRQTTYTLRDDIVGRAEVEKEAMDWLEKDGDIIVAVCLQGMGGIGKSTIGWNILAKFQEKTAFTCGRVELPLEFKGEDLSKFQKEILDKLCKVSTPGFVNCCDGAAIMKKQLKNIKEPVFLYLDNVLDRSHLKKLLPEAGFFPNGSRILVTTRHEEVFTGMKLDLKISHHCERIIVPKLDLNPAKELLWNDVEGGRPESLNAELEALEGELLELCNGLPLALVVVSGYTTRSEVGPTDTQEWLKAITAMKNAVPLSGSADDELYSRLKFSIDLLHPDTRKAFLDIVGFAVGMRWEYAEALVSKVQLEILRKRALVEEEDYDDGYSDRLDDFKRKYVRVHDVMKALGSKMVKEDENEIRIVTKDGLEEACKTSGALNKVVGLKDVTVSAPLLQQMHRVRLLRDVQIEADGPAATLSNLLVFDGMTGTSMALDIPACTSLKILSWKGGNASNLEAFKCPQKLEELAFWCGSLQALPEGVAGWTGLRSLDLGWCGSLQALPEGVAGWTGLRSLDLRGCGSLQALPEGVAGKGWKAGKYWNL